jgi:hypothetical protein
VSAWFVNNVPSWLLLLGLIVLVAGGAVLIQMYVRHRFPELKGDAHNDPLDSRREYQRKNDRADRSPTQSCQRAESAATQRQSSRCLPSAYPGEGESAPSTLRHRRGSGWISRFGSTDTAQRLTLSLLPPAAETPRWNARSSVDTALRSCADAGSRRGDEWTRRTVTGR